MPEENEPNLRGDEALLALIIAGRWEKTRHDHVLHAHYGGPHRCRRTVVRLFEERRWIRGNPGLNYLTSQ